MPALFLTCPRCRQEFRSGVSVSLRGRSELAILGVQHPCTHCNEVAWYFTDDYHWAPPREARPMPPAEIPLPRLGGRGPPDGALGADSWPPSERRMRAWRRLPLGLHP